MAFDGMVIRESLLDVSVLERLNVVRVETWDVTASAIPGQSMVWSATYIGGSDDEADLTAALISQALLAGPWYANISTPDHDLVIFKGRVVKYRRGDAVGYRAAQEFARSVGVPEHQLAWRSDLETCRAGTDVEPSA